MGVGATVGAKSLSLIGRNWVIRGKKASLIMDFPSLDYIVRVVLIVSCL
jgi:hypothetical protein